MASKQTAFRELDDASLVRALAETKEELFNLRFQHVTGQLDNNSRLRQVRRDVIDGAARRVQFVRPLRVDGQMHFLAGLHLDRGVRVGLVALHRGEPRLEIVLEPLELRIVS